jgi:DNA-binding protein
MEGESYEARVTENGKTKNYIKGAMEFLEGCGSVGIVSLTARGRSINKLVTIVEIIKKHHPLLQQTSDISWKEIEEKEEDEEREEDESGLEEGQHERARFKSIMSVTLRRIAEEKRAESNN